jgi:putative ABC transport system permease protein
MFLFVYRKGAREAVMRGIAGVWQWIRSIVRPRALEDGFDEEIQFHLDQLTAKNRRAGMSPDEARRQALVKFGGRQRARESTRDEIRPPAGRLLGDLWQDLRYAARALRKQPTFALAAILTLALSIGGITAIFSAFDTILLRALPIPTRTGS